MSIFRGSTVQCLAHLKEAIKDAYLEKRHLIASFVGVGDQTLRRWFKGEMAPVGEQLVRLRFYLEFLGYAVNEVEGLSQPVRDAARLFAFRIVTLSTISELVGYASAGNDSLLAIFRGARGVSKEKLEQFTTLVELHKDQLDVVMKSTPRFQIVGGSTVVRSAHAGQSTPAIGARAPSVVRSIPRMERRRVSQHDAIIQSLADLVKAATPLAQLVSSDEFTPEDRARVRELAGVNGVFVLANTLYRLCGERARDMNTEES